MSKVKKLGIIGGMSWESTQLYYQHLNRGVRQRLGGLHSAELLLYSFDFARIEALQASGDWAQATQEMIRAGMSLKNGGADMIMIATNTMHKMADEVEQATNLPLLHIADATAGAVNERACKSPLLLATNFTMTQDFYKGRLSKSHNIEVIVPTKAERQVIHDVIYHELCQGDIKEASKQAYLRIIQAHIDSGQIDSVIMGCTEIGLLIGQSDMDVPCFDTTAIHCEYAIKALVKD